MAATFYKVTIADNVATVRPEGTTSMIVCAESEQDAKDIAASYYTSDHDAVWDAATVTELPAATDLEGLRTVIGIRFTSTVTTEFSYTADETDDWDDVIDELVTLLDAHASIANVTNEGSGVLRIGAADNLGAKVMVARVEYNSKAITGLAPVVDAVTTAGTKRDFTFDTALIRPVVFAAFK